MLVVETIARIRREFFVRGKPIKKIVRDVKVSRNTVRKVIRSEATAFSYDRRVQPMPKLGAWRAELERLLEVNEAKGWGRGWRRHLAPGYSPATGNRGQESKAARTATESLVLPSPRS